jgi:chromosome segregation ATPase
VEKEFEQLKHDYSDLNIKQKELLNNCKTLEDENQNLLQTIEQLDQEKLQLKQTYEKSEENFSNQITQLIEQQSDKQHLESLQTRITNYENAVSQYEEYRLKLENNLQKITQQRDTHKMDLRLTKEMLTNKEQFEKDLQKQILELNQTIQVLIQLS